MQSKSDRPASGTINDVAHVVILMLENRVVVPLKSTNHAMGALHARRAAVPRRLAGRLDLGANLTSDPAMGR